MTYTTLNQAEQEGEELDAYVGWVRVAKLGPDAPTKLLTD